MQDGAFLASPALDRQRGAGLSEQALRRVLGG